MPTPPNSDENWPSPLCGTTKKGFPVLLNGCWSITARPSRCNFSNNLISPCLTAKMGTGGNNIPVVVVQKRRLTEKECLKIMGFPDDYKISNGLYSYKQIGNSVVVPVLEEIARQITNVLWGVLNK